MNIFRRNAPVAKLASMPPDVTPPRPSEPLAIVGDIHGRLDLLKTLLDTVDQTAPDARLVFVGDYVDRGPDSRAVLERLQALENAVCLMGNHEAMMLEFLEQPIEKGGRWLRNGGVETLASYGIHLTVASSESEVIDACKSLRTALSDGTRDWLQSLPLCWQSGTLMVTHAGPDPSKPIDPQDIQDFLWGHPRFLRDQRQDGLWVAHGHWIQDRPNCKDYRIAIDTGAWKTGVLSAALVDSNGLVRFADTR